MLWAVGTVESSMSTAGLDNRHRNKDGEISGKHGNTVVRTVRKIYVQGFAAGYQETAQLSGVMLQLNETSLSQLRRDHETHHFKHKLAHVSE
jgi:predicted acetyltransferase